MKTSPPKRPDWLPHPCLSFSPTLVSPLTSPFPIRPACTRARPHTWPGRRPGPARRLLPGLLPPCPATLGPATSLLLRVHSKLCLASLAGPPLQHQPTPGPGELRAGTSCSERWRHTSRAETQRKWDGPPGRGHSRAEEAAGGAAKREDWERHQGGELVWGPHGV